MSQTHILGKDAALETSIATMQAKLAQLNYTIVEKSWLNPIANVWSVHIHEADCPLLFTNGKGASKKAALASALGEFIERLSCNYFWADYYLGDDISCADFVHYPQEQWFSTQRENWKEGLLNKDLWATYDPDNSLPAEAFIDLNSSNPERGICAVPYTRQSDGQITYFPVALIGNLFVSNGMSAGNTPAEARVQALSEIYERAIKFKIIREGLCLPDVPTDILARYPSIQAGIESLEQAGYPLLIKDASLGGQYPVLCVTLLNPKDQGCYASFGAHPNFEIALERALTELLQGRALDSLDGFEPPDFDLDDIASLQNIETHFIDSSGVIHWNYLGDTPDYAFADWCFQGTTQEECESLCQQMHSEDLAIYIADYEHLGMYACRILVPNFSEIYPPEDLIWANNNQGNAWRKPLLSFDTNSTKVSARLLDEIEENAIDDQMPVAELIGLPADKGSIWQDLRTAELKTLLALKTGDKHSALQYCQWVVDFGQIHAERLAAYNCLKDLLSFHLFNNGDYQPYRPALSKLHGTDNLKNAEQLLAGETIFSLNSEWHMHKKLITAYQKLSK